MSQILSLRVPDQMVERLERFARRQGNGMSRTKAGMVLLEEALREVEFAFIEYRDSSIGRQAYLKGSGLAIWEVILILRSYGFDAERAAQNYPYSAEAFLAAKHFYDAYRDEIDQAIEDNTNDETALKRLLPGLKVFVAPQDADAGSSS